MPFFLSLTEGAKIKKRNQIALKSIIIAFFIMIGGSYIVKFLPKQFLHTTARVMAFILAALATQFIVDGIKASFNI